MCRECEYPSLQNPLFLLLQNLICLETERATMSTTASSLALQSLTPKTLSLYNPKPTLVSLFSISPSTLRLQCKPISISASLSGFRTLSSRFARNVAVSSEFDQEEDLLSDEDAPGFAPDLKLFVGNLPFTVDSAQLAGLFESAGNVEMVEVFYYYSFPSLVFYTVSVYIWWKERWVLFFVLFWGFKLFVAQRWFWEKKRI